MPDGEMPCNSTKTGRPPPREPWSKETIRRDESGNPESERLVHNSVFYEETNGRQADQDTEELI